MPADCRSRTILSYCSRCSSKHLPSLYFIPNSFLSRKNWPEIPLQANVLYEVFQISTGVRFCLTNLSCESAILRIRTDLHFTSIALLLQPNLNGICRKSSIFRHFFCRQSDARKQSQLLQMDHHSEALVSKIASIEEVHLFVLFLRSKTLSHDRREFPFIRETNHVIFTDKHTRCVIEKLKEVEKFKSFR